jgi:hypothetical protein
MFDRLKFGIVIVTLGAPLTESVAQSQRAQLPPEQMNGTGSSSIRNAVVS